MGNPERPHSFLNQRIDRRTLIRETAKAAPIIGATLAFPQLAHEVIYNRELMQEVKFSPRQLGTTIQPRGMAWFGLDENEALDIILALPGDHVRIGFSFDDIFPREGVVNFSRQDRLVEKAIKRGKKIHAQLGIKTYGYPEVNIGLWMFDKFPYLREPDVQLDEDPHFQEFVLQSLEAIGRRYLGIRDITSIHIENEAFSRRLEVSKGRYISTEFNQQEVALVRSLDPFHRPIVQNVPFDTPETIPHVLGSSDILGLNIYNQVGRKSIPGDFLHMLPSQEDVFWWLAYKGIDFVNLLTDKEIWVTEYQTAAWLKTDKTPKHHFDLEKFFSGLLHIKRYDPEIVFLWDVEQAIWRRKHFQDKEHLDALYNLAA